MEDQQEESWRTILRTLVAQVLAKREQTTEQLQEKNI